MRFYAQTMSSPSAFKWVDDSILNVGADVTLCIFMPFFEF